MLDIGYGHNDYTTYDFVFSDEWAHNKYGVSHDDRSAKFRDGGTTYGVD